MQKVEPKVFLIAKTETNALETCEWLEELGVSQTYAFEAKPEALVELAGRRCYKSFEPGLNPNVTKIRTDQKEYFENILKSKHGSVLEHITGTFAIENVSRVFTHELVRHRVGVAYSQESLRYVRLDSLKRWLPDLIRNDSIAKDIFDKAFAELENYQLELAGHYNLDDPNNKLSFEKKKEITSAMRRIAPIGLGTGIVMTANIRSLRHMLEMRTAKSAEVEMRIVFNKIAEICCQTWPLLFQDFYMIVKDPENPDSREWVPKYSKV